ncbi:MAG: twin-arginine translocation signal domain-containing protein [Planctomycetota bacterium]|nr:twin-arginine translocation signal domain-containing protein [Planctomycetota bacterium]
MKRRNFLKAGPAAALAAAAGLGLDERLDGAPLPDPPPLPFQDEKSGLRITSVRPVRPRPRRPLPSYRPAAGSWSTGGVEVANPMSIYPKYKPRRSLFMADDLGPEAVEITTDRGIRGIGFGGPGAGFVVEKHLTKLLLGEDPFNVERLWDILWRSTLYYGRKGLVVHAISAVDLALWDIVGQALGQPIYKLLGGAARPRIPAYCTGNDIEQHVEFGFKKLKLAIPHGPADGREGMRKNVDLVKRAREALGPDGEIMLDCWMAFTERYTVELAKMLEPYRVYWMEECLPPDDYAGFRRLNRAVRSTRIVTGEHEYTRYGFRLLLEYEAAAIWQPDMNWCGGLTELRRIGALAAAHDIPVILHGGWRGGGPHYILATPNSPWCETFMPPPGGPPEVYRRFEEENGVTRGPEGIYVRPADRPGFGWDLTVE